MLESVRNAWRARHFRPGIASLLTNPYHLARSRLYRALSSQATQLNGRILDVGCGSKPYEAMFSFASSYEGLDIDQPRNRDRAIADHFYDGNVFPFPNESFDCLICSQVLEHVFDPENFCRELARILKPGGRFLMSVPFVWDEHEQPWDSRRYTSFGINELLSRSGFIVLKQEKLLIGFPAIIQLVQARLQKGLFGMLQSKYGKLSMIALLLNGPLNCLGEMIDLFPEPNSDLYLDNFLLLERNLDHA